jgi:uncharacterized membrane-anchored protein YjiN (DUF445 family)
MNKEKWMLVDDNKETTFLRWEEAIFSNIDDNNIDIFIKKENRHIIAKITKQNNHTKVMELLVNDSEIFYLIDFLFLDSFFEENHIIFSNRTCLHKEIRRYIYYSLN